MISDDYFKWIWSRAKLAGQTCVVEDDLGEGEACQWWCIGERVEEIGVGSIVEDSKEFLIGLLIEFIKAY